MSQNTTKSNHTIKLLGCSPLQLRRWLESKFKKGMTWDNYGLRGWHIDHIKPCASFNLLCPKEQQKCFHYTNLQPMWWEDNLRKLSFYKGKLIRKFNEGPQK